MRDWILTELIQRGIRAKGYQRKDGTYGIWLNGINACQSFLDEIGFFYTPKNKTLKRLIQENRGRVNSNLVGVR